MVSSGCSHIEGGGAAIARFEAASPRQPADAMAEAALPHSLQSQARVNLRTRERAPGRHAHGPGGAPPEHPYKALKSPR